MFGCRRESIRHLFTVMMSASLETPDGGRLIRGDLFDLVMTPPPRLLQKASGNKGRLCEQNANFYVTCMYMGSYVAGLTEPISIWK